MAQDRLTGIDRAQPSHPDAAAGSPAVPDDHAAATPDQPRRVTAWARNVSGAVTTGARRVWGWAAARLGSVATAEAADPPDSVPERLPVPTLWLLGKTGAGKSSLVRALTGLDGVAVGNGFQPCTRTAQAFDFPADAPVMRFLDTRGLGEVEYDAGADLTAIGSAAHAVLAVMRLDDPVQGAVAAVLAQLRGRAARLPVILVHNGADLVADPAARDRVRAANRSLAETAWGRPLPEVTLDLSQPATADLGALHDALVGILPSVVMYLTADAAADGEEAAFADHRGLVLGYAGSTMAGGAVPVVGGVSVAALQLAMLRALAARYGVTWDRGALGELAAGLGAGILGAQALGLAAREGAKLIPVIGQTAAPVAGATSGFAVTWALGRAAAWWLYHRRRGEPVDTDALRATFAAALTGAVQEGPGRART